MGCGGGSRRDFFQWIGLKSLSNTTCRLVHLTPRNQIISRKHPKITAMSTNGNHSRVERLTMLELLEW
ncbi:hypothetical protein NC653_024015 [Populus alba x Populus x berolinensis]|uniref:Uncharacterized protein n=1 Tax=Populus alba x Populus x berolinensis TaxID=444605 RepID=A0AAD6MKA7_9ROSI|nr:hypothetical protein NC653_024015 [Populus alba x Populus x berolinensis]